MELNSKYLILGVIIAATSCIKAKKQSTVLYDYYNKDTCVKIDSFQLEKNEISKDLFQISIYKDKKLFNTYKEFINPQKGIFEFCNNKFELVYPFEESKILELTCFQNSIFKSSLIQLKQNKIYNINGKSFEIKSFVEYSPTIGTVVSYFCLKFGFLCYYLADKDAYFLARGNDDLNEENLPISLITKALIIDTSYFGKFISKKLPNIPPPPLK